jgi:hypothetical protein
MSDEVICEVCGHDADHHRFAIPIPLCARCPDRICQNGPDGEHYRRATQVGGGE